MTDLSFLSKTVWVSPKIHESQGLLGDGLSCFVSIRKFGKFKMLFFLQQLLVCVNLPLDSDSKKT